MDNIKDLIAKLKPKHSEKVRRKELAMSTWKGQDYSSIASRIKSLKSDIENERNQSIREAEREYKTKHKSQPPPSFLLWPNN